MTLLGRALSRDASYYTIGMASVFPLGIATALITTHYLEPTEYGQFGLLMLFASLATVVYGLGLLQGTLRWAYGTAGDDGDDDGGDDELVTDEPQVAMVRARRRRVLGSGLVLATIVAAAGTAVLIIGAPRIAELIGGTTSLRDGVVWAAISAGLGSLWRLGLQVYRMERRAAMYLVVSVSRPLFALVLTVVLLSEGYGLAGAVAAVAIGTGLSLLVALGAALSSYAIGFRPADFAEIVRRGRRFIPIILAVWLVGNADLWVLSRFSTGPEVGLYRLASRLGVFPSYVTSAYLMAWMPMQRSSIFQAAVRERTRGGVSSTMFTYYCIGAMGLLLLLTVGSELFIGLAPQAYADAAPLVPAVAASVTAQGACYALYRIGKFSHRRLFYILMITLAALVMAGLGSVLAGPLGGFGVALAGTIGSLMGAAGIVIRIHRGRRPIPFQWRRIGAAVAVGGVLIVLVSISPATGVLRVAQDAVALVLYEVALVVFGVVPRGVVRDLASVIRAALPRRAGGRAMAGSVDTLSPDQRDAILQWVGHEPTRAPTLDVDPRHRDSLAALTRGLRALTGEGEPSERDAELGAYLTYRGSHVDRDLLAEQLVEGGADVLDVHVLDNAYQALRQARRKLPPGAGLGDRPGAASLMP